MQKMNERAVSVIGCKTRFYLKEFRM